MAITIYKMLSVNLMGINNIKMESDRITLSPHPYYEYINIQIMSKQMVMTAIHYTYSTGRKSLS